MPAGKIEAIEKDLIGYKKCRNAGSNYIVTLLIPKGTLVRMNVDEPKKFSTRKRVSIFKRRAEKAIVLSVVLLRHVGLDHDFQNSVNHRHTFRRQNNQFFGTQTSTKENCDGLIKYEVGKTVEPFTEFSMRKDMDCASGIHFFTDPLAAVAY